MVFTGVLAAALASAVPVAFAAGSPPGPNGSGARVGAWLSHMADQARGENYEGTFVYMEGGHLETFRVIHRVTGHTTEARMYALNGEHREVHRVDGKVNCFWPDAGEMLKSSTGASNPFPNPFPANPAKLAPYYRFRMFGTARVADHECRRVGLIPRDGYRYGYRMCLQPGTGMLLESRLMNARGKVLQQVLYTRISYPRHIDSGLLKPKVDTHALKRIPPARAQPQLDAGGGGWKASRLPPGFRLVSRHYEFTQGRSTPVQHIVYTDGLATVSLFVGPVPPSGAVFNGVSREGSINAFGTVRQGHQVTVVGSVPMQTLRMIGTSVQSVPAGGGKR
ncbi:MAG TPA: MucB/RseB C-terminal domain-containing protein [Gammaproteobacteria bacterium]|nr:MucB/RseB C-terminal domain-containing protein [Gammaproteobacteria bacterium]